MADPQATPKKRSILKKILLGFVIAIGVFLIVVALQPAEFHITRSATIGAAPAAVFAQVNDFHLWEAWSPWQKIDPTMKQTYEGAASGTGAVVSWIGEKDAGQGRMTLTESRPSESIKIRLDFIKPFDATNAVEFTFKPEGNGTQVSWIMDGRKNFVMKAFGLFMDMDKCVGGDFEKGLAQLKSVAEAKKGPGGSN